LKLDGARIAVIHPLYNQFDVSGVAMVFGVPTGLAVGVERGECHKFATEVPFIAQLLVPQNTLPLQ
jgi:hypothetical protein